MAKYTRCIELSTSSNKSEIFIDLLANACRCLLCFLFVVTIMPRRARLLQPWNCTGARKNSRENNFLTGFRVWIKSQKLMKSYLCGYLGPVYTGLVPNGTAPKLVQIPCAYMGPGCFVLVRINFPYCIPVLVCERFEMCSLLEPFPFRPNVNI